MAHINSNTRRKIAVEIDSDFELISLSVFKIEENGPNRTRYTVRKVNGTKLIHLIGYEDGTIRKV